MLCAAHLQLELLIQMVILRGVSFQDLHTFPFLHPNNVQTA